MYDDATTTTTETVPASTTPTVIVIAISVGVVGLVLVVGAFVVCMILLFCLIRRRKKRKNARHVNPVLNGKPVKDNDEVISLESKYDIALFPALPLHLAKLNAQSGEEGL